jgi:hypothetical protein
MYGMTNYQMTGIQKGIQFGHAVVEYSLLYHNQPDYAQWSTNDKTFIILDGGTTNINETRLGTLNKAADYVEKELNIPIARFHEPDLGDQLTSFVFLLDERVWDRVKYPEFIPTHWGGMEYQEYDKYLLDLFNDVYVGKKVMNIRNWISGFKLATN